MKEKDDNKRLYDELFSPRNLLEYQTILHTPLSKERSDYIDACWRFEVWLKKKNKLD